MKSALRAGLAATAMLLAATAMAEDATPPGKDQFPGQQFHLTVDQLPLPEDATVAPPAPPVTIARGDHVPVLPPGFRQTCSFPISAPVAASPSTPRTGCSISPSRNSAVS